MKSNHSSSRHSLLGINTQHTTDVNNNNTNTSTGMIHSLSSTSIKNRNKRVAIQLIELKKLDLFGRNEIFIELYYNQWEKITVSQEHSSESICNQWKFNENDTSVQFLLELETIKKEKIVVKLIEDGTLNSAPNALCCVGDSTLAIAGSLSVNQNTVVSIPLKYNGNIIGQLGITLKVIEVVAASGSIHDDDYDQESRPSSRQKSPGDELQAKMNKMKEEYQLTVVNFKECHATSIPQAVWTERTTVCDVLSTIVTATPIKNGEMKDIKMYNKEMKRYDVLIFPVFLFKNVNNFYILLMYLF